MAACGYPTVNAVQQSPNDCEDCVQIMRSSRTVQVPCTRNVYKEYTVRVPRQVREQVPRTVHYTEMCNRQKSVPYTVSRPERRTRMETQKYQVPVSTCHTRMVPVTKKVPRTVYVDVTMQVPQNYNKTTMQMRERKVPVPYFVNVPETRYRTITEQVPVQKSKVQMDTVCKTVYDSQVRTQCVPETKMVTRQIPVYNVVAKPAPPCPPGADCGGGNLMASFNAADANKDGQLSFNEYSAARARGHLGNTAGLGQPVHHYNTAPLGPVHPYTGY